MLRPCFLVVDREQAGSISTRKLVIETAKFNVITAYSSSEALEALTRFPNVDGVVLDAGLHDLPCSELVVQLKDLRPDLPILVVGSSQRYPCAGATRRLEAFEPMELLGVLRDLQPENAFSIQSHEKQLHDAT